MYMLFESLVSIKKPQQNPLGTFEDLSIHRDRQWKATLFYTYCFMMIYLLKSCIAQFTITYLLCFCSYLVYEKTKKIIVTTVNSMSRYTLIVRY
jgi:hypothetical protein